MVKDKSRRRVLNPLSSDRPHNYLYRLFSSQRFLAIIGLVFLVLIAIPLARVYTQRQLVAQEIAEVQQQSDAFAQQNQSLGDLLNYLQSDQALEAAARLNMNLKKPGEGVIVIENPQTVTMDSVPTSTAVSVSNPAKWWSYFFD